jgi:hypothetical protein
MRVKLARLVRVGGARPPPLITASKDAVYAPAEWADTLTLFHLYENMYSVEGLKSLLSKKHGLLVSTR